MQCGRVYLYLICQIEKILHVLKVLIQYLRTKEKTPPPPSQELQLEVWDGMA